MYIVELSVTANNIKIISIEQKNVFMTTACRRAQLEVFRCSHNLLKPTGYVMHQQFNIQQLYALPTLYLRVLYVSENKQRLVPLTA